MTLGRYLKKKRAELGLTLKEASELTGISIGNISMHESGKHVPNEKTLERYAKAYGIDIRTLTEPYHDRTVSWGERLGL